MDVKEVHWGTSRDEPLQQGVRQRPQPVPLVLRAGPDAPHRTSTTPDAGCPQRRPGWEPGCSLRPRAPLQRVWLIAALGHLHAAAAGCTVQLWTGNLGGVTRRQPSTDTTTQLPTFLWVPSPPPCQPLSPQLPATHQHGDPISWSA